MKVGITPKNSLIFNDLWVFWLINTNGTRRKDMTSMSNWHYTDIHYL